MAKNPKSVAKTTGKASKPELLPLDEHLAALLNPALTQERQSQANARAQIESGRAEGFGEAPQAAYSAETSQSTNITMADIALKKALRIAEATPEGPRRGDRIRDKDISRDAMLQDAPRRIRQGNVKKDKDEHDETITGSGATMTALKELLEGGDPRFRDKIEWVPHRPLRPEKSEGGLRFEIVSEYQPAGDQPTAIKALVEGISEHERDQVLLGVTGSGKTFTMAQVIEKTQRPALILAPNKTLAAQLYGEFKSFFPNNAVEYFVSYYDYYQP